MSDATTIAILIILLVLSGFIIIANTFTVFVFWIHRIKLKRTFLLVINLIVADLLVGIAQTVLLGLIISKSDYVWISTSFLAVVSGSSVFFLELISLERAFALIWPLRHRVTSIKVYIYSVVIDWCFQFANRVWDFCCNQFCNRLLGRHCFVIIYHLLVLSVNPKETLQPKSCYR